MSYDASVKEHQFEKAEDFMKCVLKTYARMDLVDFVGTGTREAIFRGIDDSQHINYPRAFRQSTDWQRFDYYGDLIPANPLLPAERANFLLRHRWVELRAVFNFLNYADKLGIPTPLDVYRLQKEMQETNENFKNIFEEIRRDAKERTDLEQMISSPFPGESVREAFALAQHYGVPTRLLDWTESPLVAMFFAASKPWKELLGFSSSSAKSISIYGVDVKFLERIKLEVVHATRFQNPRLRAQAGLFVLDPYADRVFISFGSWQSLDQKVQDWTAVHSGWSWSRNGLMKFSLVASESAKLLKLLLDYNISLETMFPSLENAALAWGYRRKVVDGR